MSVGLHTPVWRRSIGDIARIVTVVWLSSRATSDSGSGWSTSVMVGWAARVLSIVAVGRVGRLRSSVILSLTLTEETSTRVSSIERGAV